MTDLHRLWRILVTIGIVGLYIGGYMITRENDRMANEHQHAFKMLKEDCSEMAAVIAAAKKGKRNTYCDQLRHLVTDHGYPVELLDECKDAPMTDLQKTLSKTK